MTGPRRVRRARAVLVAWCDRKLVLLNYQTQVSISADPEAVRLLTLLEDWTAPSELAALLPEYSPQSIRAGIRELLGNTLLVAEGTPEAKRDADLASVWSEWLPEGSFHFATKDVEYLPPSTRLFRRYLAESSQPPLVKTYGKARRIQLPTQGRAGQKRADQPRPNLTRADSEFERVLLARRTHREFSRKQVPLRVISTLLHHTWGVTGRIDAPPFGRLFHKTSPSGGARHPGEVYLLAMRVEGLAQGLYHYDCLHHRLNRIRSLSAVPKAVAYAAGQDFVGDASALFIMTAVFPRVLWKYRFARSYRVVLLDAGHLCQTFCLVATWLGLAPFCTAAFEDSLIERDLGLDGIRESALYLAGVGTQLEGKVRSRR
jgi:SagB-type dehydrogenase family enzyme